MGPIRLIKLGGSLITDKRGERQLRAEVIDRLAGEIAELRREPGGDWLVGHGSGSFGHVEAQRHRVHEGVRSADQLPGVAATRSAKMSAGALPGYFFAIARNQAK